MSNVLTELHYLPNVAFFTTCLPHHEIWLEAHEHYQKQSYRNRCHILTANGVNALVVPVKHSGGKQLVRDVQIEYGQNWVNQHWRTLVAAYGKAPYFEYFADYFSSIFQKKHLFLFDLNLELLTICLKILQINPTIRLTDCYEASPQNGQFDARTLFHPKKVDLYNLLNVPQVYQQNFGNTFEANLSIIDLLMCQGPQAKHFLKTPIV